MVEWGGRSSSKSRGSVACKANAGGGLPANQGDCVTRCRCKHQTQTCDNLLQKSFIMLRPLRSRCHVTATFDSRPRSQVFAKRVSPMIKRSWFEVRRRIVGENRGKLPSVYSRRTFGRGIEKATSSSTNTLVLGLLVRDMWLSNASYSLLRLLRPWLVYDKASLG